jgi:hypothetical protein
MLEADARVAVLLDELVGAAAGILHPAQRGRVLAVQDVAAGRRRR